MWAENLASQGRSASSRRLNLLMLTGLLLTFIHFYQESRADPLPCKCCGCKAMNPTGGANNIRRVDRSQPWNTVRSWAVF